jgi:hypothetical protein
LSAVRNTDVDTVDRTINVWTVRTWWAAIEAVTAGTDGAIADQPGLSARVSRTGQTGDAARWLERKNG